jgi:SAM-dependent methyltransferase
VSTSDWTVWQDPETAKQFAETRRRAIPCAADQFGVVLALLKRLDLPVFSVLDAGCGDGILLEFILRNFSVSHAAALDGSPAMLQLARQRLAAENRAETTLHFIEADLSSPQWRAQLPVTRFDVIVSGFALHHLEPERQCAVYTELADTLRPGGILINIEHVASLASYGEGLFERDYASHIVRSSGSGSHEEEYQRLRQRPDKAANRLLPVETLLDAMRNAQLVDVDCLWKRYELAVLAGIRPH